LLRHGESEWNAAGRWQGQGDPPLSPRGRREAADLAKTVSARLRQAGRPVRIFSSDLSRAIETAAAIEAVLGREMDGAMAAGNAEETTRVADLRELDVGTWSGLTRSEIEAQDADRLAAFESEDPDVRPGGGETRREIRARVRAVVERLAVDNSDADLLLVVHLGVIRALLPGAEPQNLDLIETNLATILAARPGPAGG
jgi:probable phosphoglycerate mutase